MRLWNWQTELPEFLHGPARTGCIYQGLTSFEAWNKSIVGSPRTIQNSRLALQLERGRPVTTSSMSPNSAVSTTGS